MGVTKQIPREDFKAYFDRFTRQHLGEESPKDVTVEVVSAELGDQVEASVLRLLGTSYDPKTRDFELLLEDMDHLVFRPAEIWVIEEEGGFISTLELVRPDGTKELVHIQRGGPPALLEDQTVPPGV
jgi:hypothetical protein